MLYVLSGFQITKKIFTKQNFALKVQVITLLKKAHTKV